MYIVNNQLFFAFQLHFSVTIATEVSPCYSPDAFGLALIHNVTLGLTGWLILARFIQGRLCAWAMLIKLVPTNLYQKLTIKAVVSMSKILLLS
jgi:hypothetical protein